MVEHQRDGSTRNGRREQRPISFAIGRLSREDVMPESLGTIQALGDAGALPLAPVPGGNPALTLPPAPYPGLRPFEEDEWPIFFGREKVIQEIVEQLTLNQLVVVHGSSGCGKSSFV